MCTHVREIGDRVIELTCILSKTINMLFVCKSSVKYNMHKNIFLEQVCGHFAATFFKSWYKLLKRGRLNQQKDLFAQRRLRSAGLSAPSDLSLRCALFFICLGPKGSTDWQRSLWDYNMWMPRLIFTGRTVHFVASMVLWLYFIRLICYGIFFSRKCLTSCSYG